MDEEEEEDTHVCLRCQATIIGLTNYVNHRKAGCTITRRIKLLKEANQDPTKIGGDKQNDSSGCSNNQSLGTDFAGDAHNHQVTEVASVSPEANQDSLGDGNTNPIHSYSRVAGQCGEVSLHKRQETTMIDGYSMLEEYASPVTPVHKEASVTTDSTKEKLQESHDLIPRQNPSQTLFTGYGDPLLPHNNEGVALFRPFDSFNEHHKIQHEGASAHQNEPMALFKVSATSYELESQSFETRYTDFYSIQPTPQEPILNSDSSAENNKQKQEQVGSRLPEHFQEENVKKKLLDSCERSDEGVSESQESFQVPGLKYETPVSPSYSGEKSELRQDDFLSSLDLRSSIKTSVKRRHDDDDDFDDDDEDSTRPPHHHTGGKWRPGSQPPPTVGGKWRPATPKVELEDETEEVEEEDDVETPLPPTYTKGKWLPGKKIANMIKVGNSIAYHCNLCNRSLKGKENYERHLKSRLHFINENKSSGKTLTKPSLDQSLVSGSSRPVRSKKLEAQNFLKLTIARMKSRKMVSDRTVSHDRTNLEVSVPSKKGKALLGNILADMKKEAKQEAIMDEEEETVEKVSSVTPKLLCPICKLSFGVTYAPLHFASLAHIHNELENRQNRSSEVDAAFRKLILQNFNAIVKSFPFCCCDCKFYCNTHEDFMMHIRGHVDDLENDEVKTLYSCSACGDDPMRLNDLIHHLQTPFHFDNSLDLILQARQIVVTSTSVVVCPLGDGTFKYRRQYLSHRRIHHKDAEFQLSDQRLLQCSQCNFRALREKQIRTHIKEIHQPTKKDEKYHCFVCGLAFTTQRQAEVHRRSAEHRTTLGRQRGLSVTRTCNLCYVETDDLPMLRQHMAQEHLKECSPCHLCGVILPHRTDLAHHQRVCSNVPQGLPGIHSCDLCNFNNDLLAHVLIHVTMAHGQQEADGRFPCHICKTKLRSSSVKGHMLGHSNEWPHACHLCSRKFPHSLWLERHLTFVHTQTGSHERDTQSLCETCGKTVSASNLHRHKQEVNCHVAVKTLVHHDHEDADSICLGSGDSQARLLDKGSPYITDSDPSVEVPTSNCHQCGTSTDTASASSSGRHLIKTCSRASHRGGKSRKLQPPAPKQYLCDVCGIQCESQSILKTHRQEHKRRDGNQYQCPHCTYNTTHLPHLHRHLRLHTGSTPFSCSYCSYVCNNQENLRKHMLKTKRHPGRYMYECRLCDVQESQDPSSSPSMQHSAQGAKFTETTDDSGAQALGLDTTERISSKQNLGTEMVVKTPSSPHGSEIFKNNYASNLHAHILEKHSECFETKEDIINHIRSYYRGDQDSTVTTTPLPFQHKKRQKKSSTVYSIKLEAVDDALAPEDTAEVNADDVLTQIKRSLDIEEYSEKAVDPEPAIQTPAVVQDEEITKGEMYTDSFRVSEMTSQLLQEEEIAESKTLSVVAGPNMSSDDLRVSSGPRSYLRTANRPTILRPTQTQPGSQQPVRILIQHLPDGEEEGTRQVILILPEKVGGQPGDVAALLPSLGLAASPADCVSIVTVQPKDDHTHQQLRILTEHQELAAVSHSLQHQVPKTHTEGTVIVQSDQMVSLETQMVTEAEASEREQVLHHPRSVVLCSQPHEQQQVLHVEPEVFNPLHVVAEAAEALTQSKYLTHQVDTQHNTQEILTQQSGVQETQFLQEAVFDHPVGMQVDAISNQTGEPSAILQGEAPVDYITEHVQVSSEQGRSQNTEETGEIIYSFTL